MWKNNGEEEGIKGRVLGNEKRDEQGAWKREREKVERERERKGEGEESVRRSGRKKTEEEGKGRK